MGIYGSVWHEQRTKWLAEILVRHISDIFPVCYCSFLLKQRYKASDVTTATDNEILKGV